MQKRDLVVVGNGMAVCRLLDELVAREALPRYHVTVIGEEPEGAYNRILLGRLLSGQSPAEIVTKGAAWYRDQGIELICPALVDRMVCAERAVVLADGTRVRYDLAILATGSRPIVPPLHGMNDEHGNLKPGAFVYRTMHDCLQLRDYARPGGSAVVLGGGLLGLEAAKGLSDQGLHVTVVHAGPSLMNAQLDFVGGEMLRRKIEQCGIYVRTGRTIETVTGDERVGGVVLDDGESLAADVVVFACGVRPRVEVAQRSGIAINKGILVNDGLATKAPGVYAIGECCEHRGATYGLVAPAWEQAAVLVDILSGANPVARYRGSRTYARLKVAGVEVASFGCIEPLLETDRVIQVIEERRQSYRKLIVRGDRLIGAMLVGDAQAASRLVQMFDRAEPLPEDPLEVLCSFRAAGRSDTGARTVCNCHQVTADTIVQAIREGAKTAELVTAKTRAGSGCGSCRSEIGRMVESAVHAVPAPAHAHAPAPAPAIA